MRWLAALFLLALLLPAAAAAEKTEERVAQGIELSLIHICAADSADHGRRAGKGAAVGHL